MIGMILAGAVIVALSFLPFEVVKAKIDTIGRYENAQFYTKDFYATLRLSMWGGALLLLLAALFCNYTIYTYLSSLPASFTSLLLDLRRLLREIIKSTQFYPLLLIMIAAVIIRLYFLGEPMRYDESSSFLLHSSRPFTYALSYYIGPGNHLFHTLLSRSAYLLLGNEPWVLRLPALIAGILLIPVSFIVMRSIFTATTALLAAGLVCSSSVLIFQSTNARGYTLICLFFLLILGIGMYLQTHKNPSAWILFTLFSALGFYTIPIMLYPFGMVITWLVVSAKRGTVLSTLKNICLAVFFVMLLTLLLYAPVIILSGVKSLIANSVVRPLIWADFKSRFFAPPIGIWNLWTRDLPTTIICLLITGFGMSLLFHKKIPSRSPSLVAAAGIFLLPELIIHRVVPPPRIWLFLLPLFLGISASGLCHLWNLLPGKGARGKSLAFASLTVMLLLFLCYNVIRRAPLHHNEYATFRDGESVAQFLSNYLQEGDRILAFSSVSMPLRYYLHKSSGLQGFLYTDVDSSTRLLIIENYPANGRRETVEEVLSKEGVEEKYWSEPEIVKRFEFSCLYELRRLSP